MNTSVTFKPDAIANIMALNLDPIKIKLMNLGSGKGWEREQCDLVEVWYKRYLILNLIYPNEQNVPSKEIDEFWHYHILDTHKYAEDCQQTFGYFFHHFPYFGLRGEEDAKNLHEAFEQTKFRFEQEFGQPLSDLKKSFVPGYEDRGIDEATLCSACGGDCKNGVENTRVDYSIRPSFA